MYDASMLIFRQTMIIFVSSHMIIALIIRAAKFFEIVEMGAESEEKCPIITNTLGELSEKLTKNDSIYESSQSVCDQSVLLSRLVESRVVSP